jgi:tetratricopeptide (TPR) repeat protein
MAVRAQASVGGLTPLSDHGWPSRAAQAVYAFGFYLRQTVAPADLHSLYPLGRPELLSWPTLTAVFTLAAAAIFLAAAGVPRRAQAALWIYYIAMLLPVSGILQNGGQLVALRYSYLSCLGWDLLAGAAAIAAIALLRGSSRSGNAIAAALIAWLIVNTGLLQRQIAVWRDDRTLWADVLSRFPDSAVANANLASALIKESDLAGAEGRARLALNVEPDNRFARLALARSLAGQRRREEAVAVLRRGLALMPDWGDGEELLGLLVGDAQGEEAAGHLLRAAALLPASAQAQANAGSAAARLGHFAQALPFFEKAARLDPAYAGQLDRVRLDLARPR